MRAVRSTLLVAAVAIPVAVTGCGPTNPDAGDDDVGDAAGGGDAPWSSDGDPGTDASCGAQSEDIELINLGDPPDLLIVLDRSGSMAGPIPTFPPNFTPKWSIMRTAVNDLAGSLDHNIRFGLSEFPTDDDCGVSSAVRVPIDLDQAPQIATYFNNRSANGNTPAAAGLQAALAYYQTLAVNPAGRYVLFATDGDPNCAATVEEAAQGTIAAVEALYTAGIRTYVLGFGGGFVDDSVLDDAAVAGHTPRAGGPPYYYAANSAAELSAVLQQIAGGIIVPSCSYQLDSLPPNPDDVTVTLGGTPVPRSGQHTNGWDYYPDAGIITFFGTYCDQIMMGAVGQVSFVYGCPGPVID